MLISTFAFSGFESVTKHLTFEQLSKCIPSNQFLNPTTQNGQVNIIFVVLHFWKVLYDVAV